jgi:O-antigen/teichoic acid export membrane protein
VSEDTELHKPPSTEKLLRFTGWNLFGLCTPMIVAFFALPLLRGRMGEDIYGAFMFLLTVVNYLSILDLGLGRAVTQFMSTRLASGRGLELPRIFWTALAMMLGFALLGMALFFPLIPPIVGQWSKIPPALQLDAVHTLFAAGLATPFLVLTACLVGVLEANQKFKLINLIRLPMQIYTFLGPLAVAMVSHSLLAPVVALLAGKALECVIYFAACLWEVPVLRRAVSAEGLTSQRKLIRELFAMGGWMSVSSIAMLVLNQINSALMFALLPVAMVGFYATIAEMIIRLLIFPRAWVSVLFPSFSAQHALDSGALSALYAKGVKSLLLFSFPVVLVLFAFAWEGLMIWQDAAFATESAGVMRWLTAGIFVYSLSFVPFSLLQGVGRPDISAKVHLVLIPVAIAVAWVLMKQYGMIGAGIAWFIRCVLETVAVTVLAHRFAPGSGTAIRRSAVMMLAGLLMMVGVALVPSFLWRLAVVPVEVGLFLTLGWFWLLGDGERLELRVMVRRALSR